MTFNRYIFLILTLALTSFGVKAADASFELVPPRPVVEGRNFALTFRLTNADGNAPSAPAIEGCTLLYGPAVSTMQSTQIINGRLSSSRTKDFTYTYRADRAGDVIIPSIAVDTDAGTLRSRQGKLQILPADNAGSSSDNTGNHRNNSGVRADDISTQTPGQISADDLLVRVFFSKSSVYEQEPVVATIKVYTKFDISSFLPTVQPAFEGFLTEELPVTPETTLEHYNGQNYHCAVLKRLLLYPQRAGRLTVNSGRYDVTIVQYETINMGFYRTSRPVEREVTTSSNAAAIQVKPLPQPAPEGFNGAVGQFSVTTSLEPELMRTNEASVYSYIINGTGNIKYLATPTVNFPTDIDTYTPRTNIDAHLIAGGANMSGKYTTDFTIVPQEVGNFVIEGTPFVFFNPADGQYHTAEVEDMPIRVLRGNGPVAAPRQQTIDNTIDDILHIHQTDVSRQSTDINYTFDSILYRLSYLLLLLILAGSIIIYRRQIKLNADVAGRRLAKAGRVASKRLRNAKSQLEARHRDEFYASLAGALWGYISDKLGIAPSQLTRDNVAEKLTAYGVSADGTADMLDVLDRCEMARFTPESSDTEMDDIYNKATAAISAVENVKK